MVATDADQHGHGGSVEAVDVRSDRSHPSIGVLVRGALLTCPVLVVTWGACPASVWLSSAFTAFVVGGIIAKAVPLWLVAVLGLVLGGAAFVFVDRYPGMPRLR